MAIKNRMAKAWNAFKQTTPPPETQLGGVSAISFGGVSPSRPKLRYYNERSIVSAIYTRIAIDVAAVAYRHVSLDDNGRYLEDKDTNFNRCLTLQPNIDQAPRAFRQDIAMTLFDKGVAAIVPVDTLMNPSTNEIVDINSLRVGEIINWYPRHVRVSVYNEVTGSRQEVTLEKSKVAIVENPLHTVMNEPNSTLQRLIRKLGILDAVDEQSGSGKLDLIIQLPYVIKSEARRLQAEQRRNDIEFQLKDSQYGIAYTDGTEKITQLNRPAENNLLGQIEYLVAMLYGQLGITEEIMNGTANEAAMISYFNRTIEPLVDSVVEAMQRTFIGARGKVAKERVLYFRDPFKLIALSSIAEIADKFARNEIMSSNEVRDAIGLPPSKDPKADKLVNSNMPQPTDKPTEVA